jgi:hypothetical protein
MLDCKSVSTPEPPNVPLRMEGEFVGDAQAAEFAAAVGSLMYIATCTRFDILHAVGLLSRVMQKPTSEHWDRLMHVLRYLKGTADHCLVLGGDNLKLRVYSDSDYAGCLATRRSTAGIVCMLGDAAVYAMSRRQPTVALSTTEAEYMAAANGASKAMEISQLLEQFGIHTKPVTMYCDNQSSIKITKHNMSSQRTKHIDVQYHYAREHVQAGDISIEYIPTGMMIADILTKGVPGPKVQICREGMGLRSVGA